MDRAAPADRGSVSGGLDAVESSHYHELLGQDA